jgi:hypothetical protein
LTTVQDFRPQGKPATEGKPGHEPNTLVVRGLAVFAAAIISVVIVVLFILMTTMGNLSVAEKQRERLEPPRFGDESIAFPAPRLQADLAADLARMKDEANERLRGYGWVDPKAGIAHIPIGRAIEILAKSGLPKVPAPLAKAPAGATETSKPDAAAKAKDEGKGDGQPRSGKDQVP